MSRPDLDQELDRQLATLLAKGYPALAGLDDDAFAAHVEALRPLLPKVDPPADAAAPFLVVVRQALVPMVGAVERLEVDGRAGWTDTSRSRGSTSPTPRSTCSPT